MKAQQPNLFKNEMIVAAEKYESIVEELISKTIPIPRILIQQSNETLSGFRDFELDVSGLNYQPVSEEIIRRTLELI